MKTLTFTEKGPRRRNEDRLGILGLEDGACFAVLSDGMGGHECGDEAAQVVVDRMLKEWIDSDVPPCESKISEIIKRVGFAYEQNARGREMGATLVAAYACEDTAIFAHCGDIRIYLASQDLSVKYRTTDHSRVSFGWHLVDNAFFTGRCHNIRPEMSRHTVAAGYRIMLCSDGVSGFISEDEIWKLLATGTLDDACSALMDACARSSRDNYSAIIIEI